MNPFNYIPRMFVTLRIVDKDTIVVEEHYPCVLAILVVCEASCFAFKEKRIHTREVIDLSSIHDPRFRKVAFTEILSQRQQYYF